MVCGKEFMKETYSTPDSFYKHSFPNIDCSMVDWVMYKETKYCFMLPQRTISPFLKEDLHKRSLELAHF